MFSSLHRNEIIEKMGEQKYDVLIIGGGITGAGIALDATSRGMKTALVEMQDFAAGTSSRSTKLVHGGLRYLKQLQVGIVAEVGKERGIVYENGAHVTTPEWMLLPFHTGGTFGYYSTSLGLMVYDFLAGVKRRERRTMFSVDETLEKEPLIKEKGLKGGGYYVEYRTDDARLTIEVMKEAAQKGAQVMNYAKVVELLYENKKIIGVLVHDVLTGKEYRMYAKKVVNAAGPWVDVLREMDGSKKGKRLRLSKGTHVVIDQSKFPLRQAVYFDTPDKRMIFAIPRDGKAYVGTTDTFYEEDPVNPTMTKEDRTYILDAIHYMFPTVNVTEEDVESSWAGVRPLIYEEGKKASEISRKDEIWQSESGLITIAGGKLTGYRRMAETVVDLISNLLKTEKGTHYSKCSTKRMPISGGRFGGSKKLSAYVRRKSEEAMKLGFTRQQGEKLTRFYGSNIDIIFDLAKTYDENNKYKLSLEQYVQIKYSIDYEMTMTLLDFFVRRTGTLFFNISWVHEVRECITLYMSDVLNWSEEEKERNIRELNKALDEALKG